jgi:DNA-binding NarL/FixJ family response regulator
MPGQEVSSSPFGFAKGQAFSGRPSVLLADDHDMVLERVQSLLHNYKVIGTAHNGRDLVSEALRLQPDVIISDITMPFLNGIDAAHEIREAGSTARFVFLTVHEQPAFIHACFAEGALGYVTKSHLGTDLIPAINEALSGHRFVSPSIPR